MLTNLNLYNIKKDQIQRKIAISSVKAVTKSTKKNNSEFVIHVKNEYDYRFESSNRDEIFDSLKWAFWKINRINLKVYGVDDKLNEYYTSK
jgi:hypothetical protein